MTKEDYARNKILSMGISIKSFARNVGLPYTTLLSMLKNGLGGASVDNAIKLCRGLNITIDDLINSENELSNKIAEFDLLDEEKTHIEKYRSLDARGKETVDNILDIEYKRAVSCSENTERKSQARITPDKSTNDSYKTLKGKYTKYNNVNAANAIEGFTDEERLEDEKYWSDFEDE